MGIDSFFQPGVLTDEVMKIHPVQKMTSAGQRNRFVCYVLVGDKNGHIGLGAKAAKEVATAIRGVIIAAKMAIIPVRRGYWGNRIGFPHTVPMKVHGKCGSVHVRLIPAPRGSNVIGSPTLKKMLAFAGITDCYSCSCGHTRSKGNFAKATYEALRNTYAYLTPDLWKETVFEIQGELREGYLRGAPEHVRLPYARSLEGDGLRDPRGTSRRLPTRRSGTRTPTLRQISGRRRSSSKLRSRIGLTTSRRPRPRPPWMSEPTKEYAMRGPPRRPM